MPLNVSGGDSTDARSLQLLVPSRNKYEELKMMSRISANVRIPAAIINLIQKRTNSKVIKMYLEEFYQHCIGFEGQARADVIEVAQVAKMGDGDRLPS